MSNLPTLGNREFTNSGALLSGGKMYFYAAGSATPKNTYPTEADLNALTNANANPVVADANGRFGEIFLLTDAPYKVVLKTSADVLVDEWDNINATALTSYDTTTRIKQIASNPVDYGAIGDGVADESAEVQAAIDAATGVVDLLGLTFRCDTSVTLRSGITVRNGTLDFANADENKLLAQGSLATSTALTANATAGDSLVSVTSVSGLAAGDYCLLKDNIGTVGEVVLITSISVLDVNLSAPLFGSYATANAASLAKINTVDDVALEDLRIVGCPNGAAGVLLDWCLRAKLKNVNIAEAGSGFGLKAKLIASSIVACSADGCSDGIAIVAPSHDVAIVSTAATRCTNDGFYIGYDDGVAGYARHIRLVDVFANGGAGSAVYLLDAHYCSVQGSVIGFGTALLDSGSYNRNLGVVDLSAGDYDGCVFTGGGSGDGVQATGGATGPGGRFTGGSTSGAGLIATASAGNSNGATVTGHGSGAGVSATPGATGPAILLGGNASPTVVNGGLWFDSTARRGAISDGATWQRLVHQLYSLPGAGDSLVLTTNYQTLQYGSADIAPVIQAGQINFVGANIRVRGSIYVSSYAAGGVLYFVMRLGSTIMPYIVNGVDPTISNVWAFDALGTVRSTGAAATIRWSSRAHIAAGVATACYDNNTTYDLTAAQTITLQAKYATNNLTVQMSQLVIDIV